MNGKHILMTGGLGFIGSNFINYLIDNYDDLRIINFDFRGIGSNINNVKEPRTKKQEIHHIKWDISNDILKNRTREDLPFDYLFHFAAESHVDCSISTPEPFVKSNVMGTMQMLELARKIGIKKFIHVSTDECYGSVKRPVKENYMYNPSSVYSATKASAEMICNAYKHTYGMDIVITKCGNNFGPNQFDEKLVPVIIKKALNNETIPVYGDGSQVRHWVYVMDHIKDIITVAEHGKSGEIYNIGGGKLLKNIELVKMILKILDKPEDLIEFKPNARLGHDQKYAIDCSKFIKLKGCELNNRIDNFQHNLEYTIRYYKNIWGVPSEYTPLEMGVHQT